MNFFQQLRKASIGFSLVLATLIVAGMIWTPISWAASFPMASSHLFHPQIVMSVGNRTESAAQDFQGKAQEAFGNLTGNRQTQAAGQAKQATSQVRNAYEDVKDVAPTNRIEAGIKTVTGKVQETIGNLTGDAGMQAAGKSKQAEGQVRNSVENAKNRVQNAFN